MNKKKGFTLVEVLAVIVLVTLITVLAYGAIDNVSKKNKERIKDSKISLAKNAILAWANDNEACFIDSSSFDCLVKIGNGCTKSNNNVSCTTTIGELARREMIGYDKEENGVKIVIDPTTGNSMNNHQIIFTYTYDTVSRNIKFNN